MTILNICIVLMDDINDTMIKEFTYTFNNLNIKNNIYFIQYNQPHLIKYLQINNIHAIILSGSTKRILEKDSPTLPPKILKLGLPILSLCYGFEWITKTIGGTVATFKDKKEHIYSKFLKFHGPFNVPLKKYAFNHFDYIQKLPNNWDILITHDDQIWAAYHKDFNIIGLQFHPEKYKTSAKAFYNQWIAWLKEKYNIN